jgi:hypothetical protein
MGLPSVSVLEPVINVFQSYLGARPAAGSVPSTQWVRITSNASTRSILPLTTTMDNCRGFR